ncbi:hypothetical protein [Lacticaseibacillus jixiensis]|uniref:hypothetical protein n=1 Tax=Lacticaseibacillus jixiensis TaxID=3231926 RepID=UPI0036F36750
MKITRLSYAALCAMMLASASTPTLTAFASSGTENTSSTKTENSVIEKSNAIADFSDPVSVSPLESNNQVTAPISLETQTKINALIQVIDNQYVLAKNAIDSLKTSEYVLAVKVLQERNFQVLSQHLTIDPETKEFEAYYNDAGQQIETRMAASVTVTNGWNYIRVKLNTNAVANKFRDFCDKFSNMLSMGSDVSMAVSQCAVLFPELLPFISIIETANFALYLAASAFSLIDVAVDNVVGKYGSFYVDINIFTLGVSTGNL